ncbi:MAG: hypothetical protein DDT18_01924 [Actinobacteria bacterium]|nr:hypothetical protein [Actinomycetota bacterium]
MEKFSEQSNKTMLPKLDKIKLDKKSLIYLGVVILAFIIAIGLIWYYSRIPVGPEPEKFVPEKSEEERIIEQQLEALEELRAEAPPLSEEEIQTQVKELEKLQPEQKPLSEQEIQKQLEELEKLRETLIIDN